MRERKMRERKIYECDYCFKKKLFNKTQMKNHEDKCWFNPKNRTCCTCEFGEIINDSCDHPELPDNPTESWKYRVCNRESGEEVEFSDLNSLKPIVNCEHWEEQQFDGLLL